MKFTGKRIVIAGGSPGIGLQMARTFGELGADVVITGRTQASLDVGASGQTHITPFVCDVSLDKSFLKMPSEKLVAALRWLLR